MPYNFHPYPIQAKRGYKTKPGEFWFAEHNEIMKAMEATWYERIKQMDAEKDKQYAEKDKLYHERIKQMDAEKDKLYREMNDHARENSRLEVI